MIFKRFKRRPRAIPITKSRLDRNRTIKALSKPEYDDKAGLELGI